MSGEPLKGTSNGIILYRIFLKPSLYMTWTILGQRVCELFSQGIRTFWVERFGKVHWTKPLRHNLQRIPGIVELIKHWDVYSSKGLPCYKPLPNTSHDKVLK